MPPETQGPPSRSFQPPKTGEAILVGGKYYWIGEHLGRGSFGQVFKCTDEWGNNLVAKVLLPRGRPYDEIRENWIQEFNKLQTLRHPNITFIHAAFEHRDTFYLVIEQCTLTLEQVILAPKTVGDLWIPHVARDILQGLGYLHQFGYVHKDIHAANVFVSQAYDRMVPNKEPVWSFKIGDLGISRLEDDIRPENSLFAQWMIPPEVLDSGTFGAIGKPVDIYHVGLLLLALVLKRLPSFTAEQIVAGAPRELAEGCGSKFSEPIARALRRHVDARTQTAMDFWREIASKSQAG